MPLTSSEPGAVTLVASFLSAMKGNKADANSFEMLRENFCLQDLHNAIISLENSYVFYNSVLLSLGE